MDGIVVVVGKVYTTVLVATVADVVAVITTVLTALTTAVTVLVVVLRWRPLVNTEPSLPRTRTRRTPYTVGVTVTTKWPRQSSNPPTTPSAMHNTLVSMALPHLESDENLPPQHGLVRRQRRA